MTATGLAEQTKTAAGALSGVWCPALTPIDANLRPDAERLIAHVSWLLRSGCHGVVLFGTTGEANSFSLEERTQLLEAALEAGLPRDRMLVGTGCCALSDSVRLTGHALALGVAGVLMLPPFYYKDVPDEALFANFDQVIQRIGTDRFKLYLYHFPRLSGVPITPGLLDRLQRRYPETVAGVKDSSGDWQNTKMLLDRFPDLAIFPGSETLLLQGLKAGGAGCISASCNVNPRAIRKLYDDYHAGARDLQAQQEELATVRKVLQLRPLIPVMKHLLADRRGDPAWRRVRPPFLPLPDVEAKALESELAALDWQAPEF
jgi:4-hydroxy-tetrahydrodipicolinate synthase